MRSVRRTASALVVFLSLVGLGFQAGATPPSTAAVEGSTPGNLPAAQVTPSPETTATTPSPQPPGERDPIVGALAVLAIIVAGGAGIFIYRVIRKGL